MGRVIRAQHRRLGREVAIKELLDDHFEARFEREARLTARLQHPAIVSVHEARRWPSGVPFYAMKYVAGKPLSVLIRDRSRVSRPRPRTGKTRVRAQRGPGAPTPRIDPKSEVR